MTSVLQKWSKQHAFTGYNLLLLEYMLLPKDGRKKADNAVIQVRGAERDHAL